MNKKKLVSGFLWVIQVLLLYQLGTMVRATAAFHEMPFPVIMGISIILVVVIPQIIAIIKEETP